MSGEKRHALLSASGVHRWPNCTPFARLERDFEDNSGEAAGEGIAAHALADWDKAEKIRKFAEAVEQKVIEVTDENKRENLCGG